MGATNEIDGVLGFPLTAEGMREAFLTCQRRAVFDYGNDPYNGAISTVDNVVLADEFVGKRLTVDDAVAQSEVSSFIGDRVPEDLNRNATKREAAAAIPVRECVPAKLEFLGDFTEKVCIPVSYLTTSPYVACIENTNGMLKLIYESVVNKLVADGKVPAGMDMSKLVFGDTTLDDFANIRRWEINLADVDAPRDVLERGELSELGGMVRVRFRFRLYLETEPAKVGDETGWAFYFWGAC